MKKIRLLIISVLLVLGLAAAVFFLPVFPARTFSFEPSVYRQINSQYAALKSGKDIPLPIAIQIGDDKLSEFSESAFVDFIRELGFVEETFEGIQLETELEGKARLFYSKDGFVRAYWSEGPASGNLDYYQKNISLQLHLDDIKPSDLPRHAEDNIHDTYATEAGIRLGMNIVDARAVLGNATYLEYSVPNYNDASLTDYGVYFLRGCYSYLYYFSNSICAAIFIENLGDYHAKRLTNHFFGLYYKYRLLESFGQFSLYNRYRIANAYARFRKVISEATQE